MHRRHHSSPARGFTLIELLVVIGLIALLVAIFTPVVSRVRKQAYNTSTQSEMQRIMQACESYFHDFNSYPGPISNFNLQGGTGTPAMLTTSGGGTVGPITSSENLVLGLLGLMNPPTGSTPAAYNGTTNSTVLPPAHDVMSLNVLHPASYHYLDYVPEELSTNYGNGQTATMLYAAGSASSAPTDSYVPEFVDRFSEPQPIIYTRANVGNPGIATKDDTTQYNFLELAPYGSNLLQLGGGGNWQIFNQANQQAMYTNYSSGSSTLDDTVAVPFQDFVPPSAATAGNYYYSNPNIAGSVRGKDGFILIDAGIDRVYGTIDDIILTP